MQKKRPISSVPQAPARLLISQEEASFKIDERIERGRELRGAPVNTPEQFEEAQKEFHKWDSFNRELLRRLFSTGELADEYSWFGILAMQVHPPSLGQKISELYADIDKKLHRLDSIKERLSLFSSGDATAKEGGTPALPPQDLKSLSRKVFIVHGHDDLAKTSLEVFLRELGLEPIVLHRQADEGMTIIEKFEKHSEVGYAFILLTPDEVAYLKADEPKRDSERKKEKRARPNVIFEFGYFVGKLGRSRVCCLHTGGVTLPSDVNGMIYKPFASNIEEVAYGIIKDLKASGYAITVA